MASTALDETAEERACATPRACSPISAGARIRTIAASRSLNIIANAAFVGIDHPGRAFLALADFFRHVGLIDEELSPRLRELASTPRARSRPRPRRDAARRLSDLRVDARRAAEDPDGGRARPLWRCVLPNDLAALAGERRRARLRQLARLIGREPVMETD